MAEVTDSGSTDGAIQQLSVSGEQLEMILSKLSAAVRQTAAPLSPSQQAAVLKFRLLRNGLGRFESASEAFDRALIRIDQIQHEGWSQLVIHDPIPLEARTMVLVVGSVRTRHRLPDLVYEGKRVHRFSDDTTTSVVELVEFLDQFDVPIAAGVPVQLQEYIGGRQLRSDLMEGDVELSSPGPAEGAMTSRTPKSKKGS